MKLILERQSSDGSCTMGSLFIGDSFECFTLEDVVREKPGVPVADWKVFGKTAIPAGEYEVQITYSPHFLMKLPQLMNVPGFEGVRIHPGNTAADTEGCILVGQDVKASMIVRSRVAFNALFAKIEAAINAGEPVTFEIKNHEGD